MDSAMICYCFFGNKEADRQAPDVKTEWDIVDLPAIIWGLSELGVFAPSVVMWETGAPCAIYTGD